MLRPNHTSTSIHPTTKTILRLLAIRLNLPMKHTLDKILRDYIETHKIDILPPLRDPSILGDLGLPQAAGRL